MNADRLWEANERPDRSLSSIHLNVSVPSDIPLTRDFIHKSAFQLQKLQWFSYGGTLVQNPIAMGKTRPWRDSALLDVNDNVSDVSKIEFRNLRLEKDGSHIARMRQLQLLASACIQLMRVRTGVKTTAHGRVMADMYERFDKEARVLTERDSGFREIATALLEKYSDDIALELGLSVSHKEHGIIIEP